MSDSDARIRHIMSAYRFTGRDGIELAWHEIGSGPEDRNVIARACVLLSEIAGA